MGKAARPWTADPDPHPPSRQEPSCPADRTRRRHPRALERTSPPDRARSLRRPIVSARIRRHPHGAFSARLSSRIPRTLLQRRADRRAAGRKPLSDLSVERIGTARSKAAPAAVLPPTAATRGESYRSKEPALHPGSVRVGGGTPPLSVRTGFLERATLGAICMISAEFTVVCRLC